MFLQIYFTLILGGFFIIAIGLFYFLTQSKIKSLGVQRFNIDSKLATTLHETFEGIKAVKLSSLQQITIKHYSSMCYKKASYVSKKDTLSQIPLYYLELVSLLSLAIIIVYVKYYTIEGLSAIPVIIVFAAAGLKLVPSANKLIAIGQTLKFYNFSFDTIASELANINNNNCFDSDPKKLIFNDKIIFSLVSYKFENKENYILKNLNFSIYRNDCIGILGKSGSGKTTFLELLSGLAKPSNGSITVNGFSIYDNPKQWVNICSYVPQNVFLFNDSILSNIILGDRGKNHDINLLNELIIGLGLDEIINTLPNGINSVVGDRGVTLSGGQIQRIGIARAIYSRPSLLILDEATSALDNFSEKMIIKFICENLSFTKIIISHNLESFKFCNKIFELNNFNLTNISDER
jgi:ATP-binding cassette subfamily C protein